VEHPSPGARTGLCRRAAATAVLSLAGVTALWLVFLRTEWGRLLGDRVYDGRSAASLRAQALANDSLSLVTVTTLAGAGVLLLAIGLVRRRALLGVVAVGVIGASAVSAEVLKRFVITRPPTAGEFGHLAANWFPSGHATICTAIGLAAVMVTPHRWRRWTAVAAALWVAFQCSGALVSGWHRPSDAVAGALLALAWAAVGLVVLSGLDRVTPDHEEDATARTTSVLILATLLVAFVGIGVVVPTDAGDIERANRTAFVVALASIDAAGVLVVWWWWRLLAPWMLDAPRPRARRGRNGAAR